MITRLLIISNSISVMGRFISLPSSYVEVLTAPSSPPQNMEIGHLRGVVLGKEVGQEQGQNLPDGVILTVSAGAVGDPFSLSVV